MDRKKTDSDWEISSARHDTADLIGKLLIGSLIILLIGVVSFAILFVLMTIT